MPNFFTRNKTLKDSGIYWVVEELQITPEPQWVIRVLGEEQRNIKPDRYAAVRESE